MPYIDTNKVARMRKAIKAALPDYKFSVTRQHHSTVKVSIMEGPIAAVDNVNVFWFKDHLKNRPDAVKVIQTVLDCIFSVQKPETLTEDADYGTVPTFYYDVEFGKWDKPYICTDPNAEADLAIQLEIRKEFDLIQQEIRHREWKTAQESRLTLLCGQSTLDADDIMAPCVLSAGHAGYCATGRAA